MVKPRGFLQFFPQTAMPRLHGTATAPAVAVAAGARAADLSRAGTCTGGEEGHAVGGAARSLRSGRATR